MAAFSRHRDALVWARHRAESDWGPLALESPYFAFDYTSYYSRTMGTGLEKVLWLFEPWGDPAALAQRKLASNAWEAEYLARGEFAEARPLNLDPGYLTEAKLVLATTKDRDHRIYLDSGIFAEVTLAYRNGAWTKNPWTYPDYQSDEYLAFFARCREYLRDRTRS